MKKHAKKLISVLLIALMLITAVPLSNLVRLDLFEKSIADIINLTAEAATIGSYSVGDIIEFGWYPQSEVTDAALIAELNSAAGEWISYGYYTGTGSFGDGNMTKGNYMRYKDVIFNSHKYRGVIFDSYRPEFSGYVLDDNLSCQDDNGYYKNTVYWFMYEPIKWRVLDPKSGMVISETILDSQAYNDYTIYGERDENGYWDYFGDYAKTYYANNYLNSSIRDWLNVKFYSTAFSSVQKDIIEYTDLDNKAYSDSYSKYDSKNTCDKIYLLSWNDVLNTDYGFSSSSIEYDVSRRAYGSDYAKAQGLYVNTDINYSSWSLRTPAGFSSYMCGVGNLGYVSDCDSTYHTYSGIRPALNFNLMAEIFQSEIEDIGKSEYTKIGEYSVGDIIEFGWYPQSEVTDEYLIAELNSLDGKWISYEYYSGTGELCDGNMTAGNYMRYKDILYGSNKYRGVVFDEYRPFVTSCVFDSVYSHQDDNGYYTDTVYWFKYDPIKWCVLNPDAGMVMSETILDSQAYNNYIITGVMDEYENIAYWGDDQKTHYANNYANSSIREWLNNDFYDTAFSGFQQQIINFTQLDNSCFDTSYPEYDCENTCDKLYLLSWNEALTVDYCFNCLVNDTKTVTMTYGSDYAKAQGLWVSSNGASCWSLRSAGESSMHTCFVNDCGDVLWGNASDDTASNGVRPAFKFDLSADIFQSDVKDIGKTEPENDCEINSHKYEATVTVPTCTEKGFTSYTCVCGDSYISDYVDATGHCYEEKILRVPTHLSEGLNSYTCVCGDTYTEIIPATSNHSYKAECIKEPTCKEQGIVRHACVCGDFYDEYIQILGHCDNDDNSSCDHCDTKICDHMCHKTGFLGFIWKIVNLIQKFFRCNPVCKCGAVHY